MAAIRDGTRSGQSDSQYITQEVRGLLTIPNEHLVVAQKDDVHWSQVGRKDEVASWFEVLWKGKFGRTDVNPREGLLWLQGMQGGRYHDPATKQSQLSVPCQQRLLLASLAVRSRQVASCAVWFRLQQAPSVRAKTTE